MKRTLLAAIAAASLWCAPALVAQTDVDDLKNGLQSFVDKTPGALPFAASAGLDWSNAYMGQLIDTDFPFIHLGVGVSGGLTTLPPEALNPLLNSFGAGLDEKQPSALPFIVANGRIGGIILPFDIGVKVGFLPASLSKVPTDQGTLDFTYQNFGLDVRYNLIKSDLLLPDVSVGAGFDMLKAGVGFTIDGGQTFTDPASTDTLTLSDPRLGLDLSATTFELKAQVSKTLLYLITPYVGASVLMGSAKADAGVTSTLTANAGTGGKTTVQDWEDYVGTELKATGFGMGKSASTFGAKLYGGASLNILIVKLDVQGLYNLTDGSVGLTGGVRVQL